MAPKGWKTVSLAAHTHILSGGTPNTKNKSYWSGDIPWVTSADILGINSVIPKKFITQKAIKDSATNLVPKGNVILVSRVGLGKVAINQFDVCISQDSQGVIFDKTMFAAGYLANYLSVVAKKFINNNQGTAIKGILKKDIKALKILMPPLKEQEKIAEVLITWDNAIASIEKLIGAKTGLKKSLMQKLLTGKVRFRGFGEAAMGGKLPADWKKLPLKSCADVRFSNVDKKTDKTERAVKLCNYMDVYANENITDEISFMNASASAREIERFALHRGDVVITKDSEAPDDIGIPTYISQEIPDLVCGYHLALCRPKKTVASGRWLAKWFQLPQVKRYFISRANGVTRFGLATKDLYELPLWCPSVAEQERIADVIELADREILLLKKRLSELKQQKSGLMQKLLTGDIPVKV